MVTAKMFDIAKLVANFRLELSNETEVSEANSKYIEQQRQEELALAREKKHSQYLNPLSRVTEADFPGAFIEVDVEKMGEVNKVIANMPGITKRKGWSWRQMVQHENT